jgi:hypothetical protein
MEPPLLDKKELRKERKRTKAIVEFQLAQSNDEVKRVGHNRKQLFHP